jgi:hypothetical protein
MMMVLAVMAEALHLFARLREGPACVNSPGFSLLNFQTTAAAALAAASARLPDLNLCPVPHLFPCPVQAP